MAQLSSPPPELVKEHRNQMHSPPPVSIAPSAPASAATVPKLPVLMSFNPGIVLKAVVFVQPLLLPSFQFASPSVLVRLNSLLEQPPFLALVEDRQPLFSDPTALTEGNDGIQSLPPSTSFSLVATSAEAGLSQLSHQLLSRFSLIYALPSYISSIPFLLVLLRHPAPLPLACSRLPSTVLPCPSRRATLNLSQPSSLSGGH